MREHNAGVDAAPDEDDPRSSAAPPRSPEPGALPDPGAVRRFDLDPADNARLANLCGPFDEHLRQLERSLDVRIENRGHRFQVHGARAAAARRVLERLYAATGEETLTAGAVHLHLQQSGVDELAESDGGGDGDSDGPREIEIRTRRSRIRTRGAHQHHYVANVTSRDVSFGIGPAGTGKTWLAVACAVEALESDRVRRLVLARPAVEAGERLGFLPGDLAQKVDPYLRPLYDALYEMIGFDRVGRLIERHSIEIAPLAYMRGRTLNESFIILDEAQNTTIEQMKMFLTRIGFGSKAVITGDVTQIDLPRGQTSGLVHVQEVLKEVPGVGFTWFTSRDVVRHRLVARILDAYEEAEGRGG